MESNYNLTTKQKSANFGSFQQINWNKILCGECAAILI